MARFTIQAFQTLREPITIGGIVFVPPACVPDYLSDAGNIFVAGVPYAATPGYDIPDKSFLSRVLQQFNVWRLAGVRQLGLLSRPVMSAGIGLLFNHTHFVHTLDVAVLMTLILASHNASEQEMRQGQFIAALHDNRTPAFGDSVRAIAPTLLNEENGVADSLVRHPAWPAFSRELGLSADAVEAAIKGRGQFGALLDAADKIAYVARDAREYAQAAGPQTALGLYTAAYPEVCAVWQGVQQRAGQIFFADGGRLGRFLKLRAMLFRDLYLNAECRAFEYLVGTIATQYLIENSRLAPDDLLAMTDDGLRARIDAHTGAFQSLGLFPEISVETFATLGEAAAREQEILATDESVITFIEDLSGRWNSATYLPVQLDDGVRPFAEARPAEAAAITAFIDLKEPVRLSVIHNGPSTPFWNAYRKSRMTKGARL